MKRSLFALAALALAFAAAPVRAQLPVSFGIGGGISMPNGDFGKVVSSGWHGTGSLGFGLPAVPLSVRVEGSYSSFSGKNSGPKVNVMSGTVNAVWSGPGIALKPYLIGGVGYYKAKADVSGATSSSDMGFNIGGGVKFSLLGKGAYAEARFHSVQSDPQTTTFIPITVGITF
jgi:hypothetical protein